MEKEHVRKMTTVNTRRAVSKLQTLKAINDWLWLGDLLIPTREEMYENWI